MPSDPTPTETVDATTSTPTNTTVDATTSTPTNTTVDATTSTPTDTTTSASTDTTTNTPVAFASPEWFATANAALRNVNTGDATLTIEHRICPHTSEVRGSAPPDNATPDSATADNATPENTHAYELRYQHYRLTIASGRATIGPTPPDASEADVTLTQSAKTTADIRSGRLGALAAIQSGYIEVTGDVTKLLAAFQAVASCDKALSELDL